jgi:hypothetical protein
MSFLNRYVKALGGAYMNDEDYTKMNDSDLAISVLLPANLNFEYVRNHHFVRFSRKDGSSINLSANDRILYYCGDPKCDYNHLANKNYGEPCCPICEKKLKMKWVKPQVCFSTEDESDFEFPK